jgi:hypothetical protein
MARLFDNFLFGKYFQNAQKPEELQSNIQDGMLNLEKENLTDSQELNLAQIAKNLKFEVENLTRLRNLSESKKLAQDRNEILEVRIRNLTEMRKFGELESSKLKREVQIAKEALICKTCMNEKVSEVTQNSILKLEVQNQIAQDHNEKLEIKNQDLIFNFEKLTQFQKLTQSRIEILEVAQDRSKKLEVENRKFNVRQINFLKAEMEQMMSNFEKMNQSDQSAQDRIKILEVENQNLLKSWKSAQGRNLKLKRELQNEKDLRICKICMDEEISHVFLPCGHAIGCKNCINNIQKCPICRTNVYNSVKLYF